MTTSTDHSIASNGQVAGKRMSELTTAGELSVRLLYNLGIV